MSIASTQVNPTFMLSGLRWFQVLTWYKKLATNGRVNRIKSTLGLGESEKTAFRVLRPGTPAGALLNAEMDRLFEAHGADSPVFYEDMLLRFIACVRVALSPEPVGLDIRRRARDALRDLICDFLKQRIS